MHWCFQKSRWDSIETVWPFHCRAACDPAWRFAWQNCPFLDRLVSGAALVAVYTRSRWMDTQHTDDPVFVELKIKEFKTKKANAWRGGIMAAVGPALGVVQGNWWELGGAQTTVGWSIWVGCTFDASTGWRRNSNGPTTQHRRVQQVGQNDPGQEWRFARGLQDFKPLMQGYFAQFPGEIWCFHTWQGSWVATRAAWSLFWPIPGIHLQVPWECWTTCWSAYDKDPSTRMQPDREWWRQMSKLKFFQSKRMMSLVSQSIGSSQIWTKKQARTLDQAATPPPAQKRNKLQWHMQLAWSVRPKRRLGLNWGSIPSPGCFTWSKRITSDTCFAAARSKWPMEAFINHRRLSGGIHLAAATAGGLQTHRSPPDCGKSEESSCLAFSLFNRW